MTTIVIKIERDKPKKEKEWQEERKRPKIKAREEPTAIENSRSERLVSERRRLTV